MTPDRPEATSESRRAIEAILMIADSPVETHLLAQLLELPPAQIDQICDHMAAAYRDEDRGFVLTRVAGGYRFQSHPDLAPYLERFVLEGQSSKLSAAALETLAIVAYKQPVSRAQVAAIRGVNADAVLRTLHQRGYIAETGRDPGPGQAVLYGTTTLLLERLGLDRIEDLPPLAGFVPDPEVMDALEQSLRPGPDDEAWAGHEPVTETVDGHAATQAPDGSSGPDSSGPDSYGPDSSGPAVQPEP